MSSPVSQDASKQVAPFPPGLEPADPSAVASAASAEMNEARKEMRAVALQSIEKQLSELGGSGENKEKIIDDIRKLVLDDVDARVQEKSEQLWMKGKQMIGSIQAKHKEKTQALANEVAECHKRQQTLEAENENLKQVLASLASRFSMLGAVLAAKSSAGLGAAADASTVATLTPDHDSANMELFSPATGVYTPATDTGKAPEAAASTFADLPEFPFRSQQSTPLAPALSLAEALGSPQTPQQLSLASSLTPGSSPDTDGSRGPDGGLTYTFSFTLRKADGADLGLNVSHHENDKALRVEGVRPEGAVEAWNRQCAGSNSAEKTVMAGDTITSVNKIMYDPAKMLEECRDKQLLKLTVVRHRAPLPAVAPKPTTLRADASVFVPMSAGAAGPAAPGLPQPEEKKAAEEEKAAEEKKAAETADDAGAAPAQ